MTEIEIQKKEANDLKKDLTTNTFYTNNIPTTLKQQMIDVNGIKGGEKFESPQVVVPINSIFTDQELNALDLEELKKNNIICHNVVIASGTSTPIKTILEIKDYLS